MKVIIKHCRHCDAQRKFYVPKVNHLLHFLLTFLTGGFWLIPWVIITLNAPTAALCGGCGEVAGIRG